MSILIKNVIKALAKDTAVVVYNKDKQMVLINAEDVVRIKGNVISYKSFLGEIDSIEVQSARRAGDAFGDWESISSYYEAI